MDPLPGAFIVNIGEMLELASGGYLRATEHRVRIADIERISVPYFFNPRLDAQLPVLTLPDELGRARARSHRGPRRTSGSSRCTAATRWKSRLRAHPDVAAAHGYV